MTTATASFTTEFDIGRVVRRAFDAVRANLVGFAVIAALFNALPILISGAVRLATIGSVGNPGAAAIMSLLTLPVSLLVLVGLVVGQAALIVGAMGYMNGNTYSAAECVAKGAPHWWRLLLVVLVEGVLIALGLVLLLVPGLILMTRWSVASVAQVVEGSGVRASLGRSATLTKGRRWPIFGLMVVCLIAVYIFEMVLIALTGGFSSGFMGAMLSPVTQLLISPLLQLVLTPVLVSGLTSIYFELSGGGVGSARTAAVFD